MIRALKQIVSIATLVVLATAAVADGSAVRECGHFSVRQGSPAGVLNLTTRNVDCRYARKFATQVTARYPFPRHWAGSSCRSHYSMHGLLFDLRCVKGGEVIHWQGGD